MVICPSCGVQLPEGARFCGSCGAQMAVQYHPPPPLVPVPPPKKDNTVVIVVIVVVIVLLLVVLGPILYVMVVGFGSDGHIETPLGLNQMSRTISDITILISSAPNGALVDGTQISLTSSGTPTAIISAVVYNAAAVQVATYAGGMWVFYGQATRDNTEFQAGMTIVITSYGISNGDVLTISSMYDYYGTTTLTIN